MPPRPEKVPNLLSATAMDHRSVAQYGQYSAPMYSTSGFPPDASAVPEPPSPPEPREPPEMDVMDFAYALPAPTASSVTAGPLVTSLMTLAGRTVRPAEPVLAEFWLALMMMKATTTTTTARMLPPVMKIRLRISAFRAAARCAATLSRAFCCLL